MAQKFFEQNNNMKVWNYREDSNYLKEPGSDISSAIQKVDYFFLFWSAETEKKVAWVEYEFRLADEREKNLRNAGDTQAFIRIFLLDDTPLPPEMRGKRNIKFT